MQLHTLRRPLLATVLLALIVAASVPAQATPPRSLSVEDVLFGESATQLFVMRKLSDNLETHMTKLTDTLLIAINLESGQEEKAWPVQRILEAGDVFTLEPAQRIKNIPLKNEVNPFDILADENARPLRDSAAMTPADARLQKWYSKDSYVVGQWVGKPEFELTFTKLKARIEASLQMTRAALPAYEGGYDPLTDTAFSDFSNCQTTRLYLTRPRPFDRLRVFTKLRCFNKGNTVWSWLYLAVPEVSR